MKKLIIWIYSSIALGLAFSLLNIVFRADFSALAFPLSAIFVAVIAYFSIFRLLKKNDTSKLETIRKLYQYVPFVFLVAFVFRRAGAKGTSHWFDIVSVLLWLFGTVVAYVIQYYLDSKRISKISTQWEEQINQLAEQKQSKFSKFVKEIFEWIDAFIQAAFTVALLNIFIIQLYEIPSESMVPEFLTKDRVVVFKTASGPKFPLSDVGIPRLRTYERGDIVVFRNPHYSSDRKAEVKSFVSQLLYTLTFTTVNLNVDEYGNIKADPLVKRICGLPEEQLMMQDGILYARRQDSQEFEVVTDDAKWAEWNLAALPADIKDKIQDIPVPEDIYKQMIECESQRNKLTYNEAKNQCTEISQLFESLYKKTHGQSFTATVPHLLNSSDMFEYVLFSKNEEITRRILSVDGGNLWFKDFMTKWINEIPQEAFIQDDYLVGGNLYSNSNFKFNLMIKMTLGKLILRNTQLLQEEILTSNWKLDKERSALMAEAEMLHYYAILLDRRNMPVFPPNTAEGSPQFIPKNCYFMMGDNRFNSLDMRHSYEEKLVPLTEYDTYTAYYYSNMEPRWVSSKSILGTTVLRFWPWNRKGIPGITGRPNN